MQKRRNNQSGDGKSSVASLLPKLREQHEIRQRLKKGNGVTLTWTAMYIMAAILSIILWSIVIYMATGKSIFWFV